MDSLFPKKTALTMVTFVALMMVPQVFPALKGLKSMDLAKIASVFDFPPPKQTETVPANPLASPASEGERQNKQLVTGVGKRLQAQTRSLDHFYRALMRGDDVRILHYGDSPTTADLITADTRMLFQKHFGDGGLGFILMAKPWAWYNHRGVDMSSSNWQMDIGGLSVIKDGRNGLGSVSFRGGPKAVAKWTLRYPGHTSVEIGYLSEAEGGEFSLEADGKPIGTASTKGEPGAPGFARFEVPAEAREFVLRVTSGSVRLYGADFRKPGPGAVYSSLGVNGANITLLSRAMDANHWAVELQHYQPDLIVINYGTNESGFSNFVDTNWGGELRRVIGRIRAALPEVSILLMSPMDRGEKDSDGEITTLPALPRLVSMEQRIATEEGVAFFNTFEAMGGPGTMARWYSSEPRLVGADYIHPMPAGGRIVGELLYSALNDGFERYKMQEAKQHVAKVAVRQDLSGLQRAKPAGASGMDQGAKPLTQ